MGAPVNTGSKVGDMGLTILAAPFQLTKNLVVDGSKAAYKRANKLVRVSVAAPSKGISHQAYSLEKKLYRLLGTRTKRRATMLPLMRTTS